MKRKNKREEEEREEEIYIKSRVETTAKLKKYLGQMLVVISFMNKQENIFC